MSKIISRGNGDHLNILKIIKFRITYEEKQYMFIY